LNLSSLLLEMDWSEVETKICRFIKDYIIKSKAEGIVVGLSGGVDSCTSAALSALAIGGEHVHGLMLFEDETRMPEDIKHAKLVTRKFGLTTSACDITNTLNALYESIPLFDPKDKLCKGNIKARTRMIYLYYYANKLNVLACGCSDKSETMMGYFTKWGDVAGDIWPIMDLYKTQVRRLAEHIGIPREIAEKPSSPTLWPGQTAENELGLGYDQLDLILYGLEHFMKVEEITENLKLKKELVERVKHRWLSTEHKRRMLLTPKLEYRTVGCDFRLPRDPYST
jgi:NAD+ synthase